MNDKDKLAGKLSSEDKSTIEDMVRDALEWMERNADGEKEDYEDKLKEVQAVCNPIITKVYQGSGAGAPEDDVMDDL